MIVSVALLFLKPANGKNLDLGTVCTVHVSTFRAALLPLVITSTALLSVALAVHMYFVSAMAATCDSVNTTVVCSITQFHSDFMHIGCEQAFRTAY